MFDATPRRGERIKLRVRLGAWSEAAEATKLARTNIMLKRRTAGAFETIGCNASTPNAARCSGTGPTAATTGPSGPAAFRLQNGEIEDRGGGRW